MAQHQKKACEEGHTIVFLDESGFMMQPTVRRTWAPIGETPWIRPNFTRTRWTLIGALTVAPHSKRLGCYFFGQAENAVTEDFIEFLRLLYRQLRRRLLVIWDGLRAHLKAARLLAGDPRFRFEQFPGYAPELNPVESLWSWCKHGHLSNYCPSPF